MQVGGAADDVGEQRAELTAGGPYAGHLAHERAAIALVCPDPTAKGVPHSVIWDLGRAAQNMILAAWELGIGSCPATVYDHEVARRLLGYPEESAGGIMTTDFVSLEAGMNAAQAIDRLRQVKPDPELAYYLYVVDPEGRLDGVISLRDLVVAKPEAKLADLMDPHVLKVDATAPQEDVAALIAKYDLLALPVVDARRKLLGTVTVDDVVELMLPRGWKKRSNRTLAR